MLNRNGGTILLGVADDGEILGVDSASANDVVKNIVDTLNNAEAFFANTIHYTGDSDS